MCACVRDIRQVFSLSTKRVPAAAKLKMFLECFDLERLEVRDARRGAATACCFANRSGPQPLALRFVIC